MISSPCEGRSIKDYMLLLESYNSLIEVKIVRSIVIVHFRPDFLLNQTKKRFRVLGYSLACGLVCTFVFGTLTKRQTYQAKTTHR